MELLKIHECLCDRTRLRIVHLLLGGPLCVCQIQEVLQEPQVKVSRHLAYLRKRGMVSVERRGLWMIYALPQERSPQLHKYLACLQDVAGEEAIFRADAKRLGKCEPLAGCPDKTRTSQ